MLNYLNREEFRRLLLSWPARAIQYLYAFHRSSLIKISERTTHDRRVAEDIVQEAIIQVWEKHDELSKQDDLSIGPYLYAVVKNKSVTFYKRTLRLPARVLNEDDGASLEVEHEGTDEKTIDTLWGILYALPPREQQCIVMRYFQDMSYEEMATQLGVSIKAIERSLTSARKRMKKSKPAFFNAYEHGDH